MKFNMPPNDPNAEVSPERLQELFDSAQEATTHRYQREHVTERDGWVAVWIQSAGTPLEGLVGAKSRVRLSVQMAHRSPDKDRAADTAVFQWDTVVDKHYAYRSLALCQTPGEDQTMAVTAERGGFLSTGSSARPLDIPRPITDPEAIGMMMTSAQAGLAELRQYEAPDPDQS